MSLYRSIQIPSKQMCEINSCTYKWELQNGLISNNLHVLLVTLYNWDPYNWCSLIYPTSSDRKTKSVVNIWQWLHKRLFGIFNTLDNREKKFISLMKYNVRQFNYPCIIWYHLEFCSAISAWDKRCVARLKS